MTGLEFQAKWDEVDRVAVVIGPIKWQCDVDTIIQAIQDVLKIFKSEDFELSVDRICGSNKIVVRGPKTEMSLLCSWLRDTEIDPEFIKYSFE